MNNESNYIVSSFKKTVISDELSKISENVSELAIDAILEDGLLKDVPLIGTTIGFYKLGKSISARRQIKTLWKFLFRLNEVSQADRIKFLKKIENDKNTGRELLERTLFILERIEDEKKGEIIGSLFNNLVLEKIKPNDYLRLALIVDKTYLTELVYLDMEHNMNCKISEDEQYRFYQENDTDFIKENLTTVGLLKKETVENKVRQKVMGDGKITYMIRFELTDIGETLIEFGF